MDGPSETRRQANTRVRDDGVEVARVNVFVCLFRCGECR